MPYDGQIVVIVSVDCVHTDVDAIINEQAESTTPTEVSDGDDVRRWFDTFGRQVIKGTNLTLEALDVNDVNPALLLTVERIDTPLLDAVTATGASAWIDVSQYNKITFFIIASSITTGGTVDIETTPDETNTTVLDSQSITANGMTVVQLTIGKLKKLRANLSARTDGTYTVMMIGGN